jgi:multicomponent Na+:H+ antiporter subunit E
MSFKSTILLVFLWWLLTAGDPESWVIGVPSIGAALAARHFLRPLPPWALSVTGTVRFLLSFVRLSIVGGADVAGRAFNPRMPMKPGLVEHRLRSQSSTERILVAGTVSLLPGTLSAALDGDTLSVHVLDLDAPFTRELQHIEDLVAGLRSTGRGAAVDGGGDSHG